LELAGIHPLFVAPFAKLRLAQGPNIEHPTSNINIEHRTHAGRNGLRCWMLGVRCWMFGAQGNRNENGTVDDA
jgi:hypothetical protein